jgi:hypothetical protein
MVKINIKIKCDKHLDKHLEIGESMLSWTKKIVHTS